MKTKPFLLTLLGLIIALLPLSAKGEDEIKIVQFEWGKIEGHTVLTTLKNNGNNTFSGIFTLPKTWISIALYVNGAYYDLKTSEGKDVQDDIAKGATPSNPYFFKANNSAWSYLTFVDAKKYSVSATLSSDKSLVTISFEEYAEGGGNEGGGDDPIVDPDPDPDPTPDPNAYPLPSTIPSAMLKYTPGKSYQPDEINTIWNLFETKWGNDASDQYGSDFHIGNGHLGLSLCGLPIESAMLNEKTYFDGARPTNFGGSGKHGEYKRAGYLGSELKDCNIQSFEALCQLDLMKGVGTSKSIISNYNGTTSDVYREFFVSRPDNVFVMHTVGNGNPFGMKYWFKDLTTTVTANGNEATIIAKGSLTTVSATFVLKIIANEGASVSAGNGEVQFANANEYLAVLSCVSDYDISEVSYINSSRDCKAQALTLAEAAAKKGWEKLYEDHVADFEPMMRACEFNIASSNTVATEELIDNYKKGSASFGEKLMLEQLIFHYGRYKMVASSREGDQLPNNLRGLWMSAQRWNGDIHADLNIEMNYWPVENTNISSVHMAFLDYIINMATKAEWKGYAQYRAPGAKEDAWTLGNANNIFGQVAEFNSDYSEANAWFCHHLWEHYAYTLDKNFLARALPAMIGACHFWIQKMTWNSSIGKWVCPDVWSPENGSANSNAVHARQMVWELFKNTIEAINILGTHTDELEALQEKFKDIDPGLHIMNGALCEWHTQTPVVDNHRHFSHLMCLYPFAQVTPYDEDKTNFAAAIAALDLRGDGDGGEKAVWQKAWHMAMRARSLGYGSHGNDRGPHHQLELAVDYLTPGMNATCADVHQIDGNSGLTAGIAECLMQSYSGVIDILPALPEEWPTGSIRGMKARGNFEIDIKWEDHELTELNIRDCLNAGGTMRDNVQIRLHGISAIDNFHVNGEKVVKGETSASTFRAPAADNVATYTYDPSTESYLINLPKGLPAETTANFTGDVTTKIITTEKTDSTPAPVEYFNLQGIRVNNPQGGIFIRRQGNSVTKVLK